MDVCTIGGFILGPLFICIGILLGGSLLQFVDLPSVMIVVGGTFASFLISYPMSVVLKVPKISMMAFIPYTTKPQEIISTFVSFAEKARRDGLLALESDIEELKDEFLKKGLQLVVDGTDPNLIKSIMETELMAMESRHTSARQIFYNMAALAPAFGMIGTLIGLINMLAHMEDPDTIGPSMAVALVTTFYGSIIANLFLTPIGNKLANRSQEEIAMRELMIEGMLAIQSGDNPRIVEERLKAFLPPSLREKKEEE